MTATGIDPGIEARVARFERAQADHDGGTSWLLPVRRAALERFVTLGFPTTKMEAWRGTDVTPIARTSFEAAPPTTLSRAELDSRIGAAYGPRVVFVNGRFAPQLSESAPGVVAGTLGSQAPFESYLARIAPWQDDAFVALNTACHADGFAVIVPAGATLDEPLHIVFVTAAGATPVETHPRILVVAESGSAVHVVESYLSTGVGPTLTNAVTEIAVASGARVVHTKIQQEGAGAHHIATIQATLGRDAEFTSRSFALGARLARTEVRVGFTATGGTCVLDGLYVLDGAQHSDNRTLVDHLQPDCTSRQMYKGVLAGASRGVFQGRVLVRAGAQHTDAQQANRNLILSEAALVDTQPQLEILADDVRCTHGATIGRLDDDARFYLQSRGIAADDAESLLTRGFAHEVIDAVAPAWLRDRIADLMDARFAERFAAGGAT